MSRSWLSRASRRALVLVLVVAFGALASAASGAIKTFSLNINVVPNAGAGTTQQYSSTITNNSGTPLDSVTISVPESAAIPGFKILSASGGTVSSSGGSVTFSGLGLNGTGSSTTVSFRAVSACASGTFDWSATGKAANNQSFTLDAATSSVATTLIGACSLAISHVGSAEKNTGISTLDYTATADPVTVRLLDSTAELITSTTGPVVTLTLSPDSAQPNASWLQGGSANLADGVASFTSLSVTQSALSYTVTASVPANTAITNATSNAFQIWDKDIKCHANTPCGQPYQAGDLITEPRATFPADGGILVSYDVQAALCEADSYNHLPVVVTVDSEGHQEPSGNWVITFSVSKQFDQQQPQNGASFYQLCLATQTDFFTLDGSRALRLEPGGPYYGLVQNHPHCTDPAPCLLSKNKTRAGIVIIVLRLEAGDPWTH